MKSVDDAQLIDRIAGCRDKAAFEVLFERHRNDAYNIACHITGSATQAEDAVQDAMLRVWLSAHGFRGEGNARGWILKVVARESLKKLRRRRKDSEKDTLEADRQRMISSQTEGDSTEREELLASLRDLLGQLPQPQRQLVALYYGAGLTQQQISEEMHLPARTVSYRLEESLEWLRKKLKGAGLAAALPLVDDRGLGQALCTCYTAPHTLSGRVLEALDTAATLARASGSLRAAAFWSTRSVLTAAVLLIASGIGIWLYLRADATPASRPTAAEPFPVEALSQREASAPPHVPQTYTWGFEGGIPEDLRIEGANWKLLPGKGKSGDALYLGYDKAASEKYGNGTPCFFYPKQKVVPPLHISFDVFIPPNANISTSDVFWMGEGDTKIDQVLEVFGPPVDAGPYKVGATSFNANSWLRINIYVTKDYVWGYHEDTPRMFADMKRPWRSEHDCLGMTIGIKKGYCRIDNLRIEEIDASQLPPKLDSNGNPIPQE